MSNGRTEGFFFNDSNLISEREAGRTHSALTERKLSFFTQPTGIMTDLDKYGSYSFSNIMSTC